MSGTWPGRAAPTPQPQPHPPTSTPAPRQTPAHWHTPAQRQTPAHWQTPAQQQTPAPGPQATRWLLVAVLAAHTAAAVAQPLLAGRYLSGDVDAIGGHSLVGTLVLPLLCMLQVVAAVLFWRPGRGPGWPALASVLLFFAEGFQIGMGYSRTLGVHIPLGVAIVTTTVGMFVWSLAWRPRPPYRLHARGVAHDRAVTTGAGAPWR